MQTLKFLVLTGAAAIFFNSCNNPPTEESSGQEMHEENGEIMNDESMQQGEAASEEESEIVATSPDRAAAKLITDQYLEIKNALVASDAVAAQSAANQMVSTLNDSENGVGVEMLNPAQKISNTEDLARQREHFLKLSQNMYQLAKQYELGRDLYWQHCPMAFDGEGGNWVSQSKEIRNPYYGDQMLKCGRVDETL